jgi:RNA polymerase sigma factor (sigma-70 family)
MRLIHRPSRPHCFRPLRGSEACRLAWCFAHFHANDVPVEELVGEALCALTYASSRYEEARDIPFGAYATLVIRHYLTHAIHRWRREKRCRPLPRPTRSEGDVSELADRRPAPDAADGAAARELCERIRRFLPAQLYEVLYLYHGEGHTFEEIGARVGLTRQRVRQIVVKATNRVRKRFPKEMS